MQEGIDSTLEEIGNPEVPENQKRDPKMGEVLKEDQYQELAKIVKEFRDV